ncbi:hypothetical protein AcV5_006669 [Taiwanofungus camphoratus]|nr:hypothetical protein AcV5_006669 [Antrodia cinnamomea]
MCTHVCETDPTAACRPTPRPRVGGKEFWTRTASGCRKVSTIPPPASLGTMGTIAKLGGSATLRRQSAQCHRQRLWPHTQSPANLLFLSQQLTLAAALLSACQCLLVFLTRSTVIVTYG